MRRVTCQHAGEDDVTSDDLQHDESALPWTRLQLKAVSMSAVMN
ncbi:MAG: hypothetical protein RL033_5620 [Pseudomonadota bacterium]|jgi:hypothetical protein